MPTTSVQAIADLTTAHIHQLDAEIDGFREGFQRIADGLIDMLIDIGARNDWQAQSLTRQIAWIQSQMRGQLNKLGYQDLAERFISGYDESELFGRRILQEMGRLSGQLIPFHPDTVRNLRNFDLLALSEYGDRVTQVVSRELVLNTVVGKKRSEVIRALTETLDGQVEQATMLADTSLRSFDRFVNDLTWREAGITHYRYFGPADNRNRPFCASRVGKIYRWDEIRRMDNGSSRFGNVLLYGGGARCRHTWSPVVETAGAEYTPTVEPAPRPQRRSRPARSGSGSSFRLPTQMEMLTDIAGQMNSQN